ncbi:MAG: NTP transferase domain-containing protein, partial [Myxococcales bacterium]|nr:NTP transferase domain-containing protein [Myxococcales bacterium]
MRRPVAVILAAGKGTRMGSDLAKVLHRVAGAPMVHYPIQAARDAGVEDVVVVVGHQAAAVEEAVRDAFPRARFAEQREQRGTGHAVLCALPELSGESGPVLILSGDVPLLRASTLRRLIDAAAASSAGLALATFEPAEVVGYGRILREGGRPVGIREERDASPE